MGIVVFVPLYVIACALLTLYRAPGSIRERLSARWPALVLLVLALLTFGIFSDRYAGPFAIVVLAGLLVLVAPAAAEVLVNAVRHSGAARVQIRGFRLDSALRVEVTDDGCGGADAARGTGLAGVERRLATFDGILAVSSPVGGPTIVVIEVPCALSSAKISIS